MNLTKEIFTSSTPTRNFTEFTRIGHIRLWEWKRRSETLGVMVILFATFSLIPKAEYGSLHLGKLTTCGLVNTLFVGLNPKGEAMTIKINYSTFGV
jgi:hypothetical protein